MRDVLIPDILVAAYVPCRLVLSHLVFVAASIALLVLVVVITLAARVVVTIVICYQQRRESFLNGSHNSRNFVFLTKAPSDVRDELNADWLSQNEATSGDADDTFER